MTALLWDQIGDKTYETGVERGVLYLSDGTGVAWNGLTGMEEQFAASISNPVFFEGVKFHEIVSVSDFSARMRAFTYPDEFLEFEGVQEADTGFYVTAQTPKMFGLSWRTRVGTDLDSEAGYKLHIVAQASAVPVQKAFKTQSLNPEIVEFEWTVTAIPSHIPGFRPTAHLILDSTKMDPDILLSIEEVLYGTESVDAKLPSFVELVQMLDIPPL